MRALIGDLQNFIDILVSHLVLQHFDNDAPRFPEGQRPLKKDLSRLSPPQTQATAILRQGKYGTGQRLMKQLSIESVPLGGQSVE